MNLTLHTILFWSLLEQNYINWCHALIIATAIDSFYWYYWLWTLIWDCAIFLTSVFNKCLNILTMLNDFLMIRYLIHIIILYYSGSSLMKHKMYAVHKKKWKTNIYWRKKRLCIQEQPNPFIRRWNNGYILNKTNRK